MIQFAGSGLSQGRGGLLLQRGLGEFNDDEERGVVRRGDVGDDFAIQFALGSFQALDEAAVSDASFAGGGVDTSLPEIAEGALFHATIAISVLTTMIHGVGSVAIQFGAFEAKAFSRLQHTIAAFAGGW